MSGINREIIRLHPICVRMVPRAETFALQPYGRLLSLNTPIRVSQPVSMEPPFSEAPELSGQEEQPAAFPDQGHGIY